MKKTIKQDRRYGKPGWWQSRHDPRVFYKWRKSNGKYLMIDPFGRRFEGDTHREAFIKAERTWESEPMLRMSAIVAGNYGELDLGLAA